MAHTSIVSGYSTVKLHRGTVGPGLVRRIFYAMVNARQLKADREVAEILARHRPLVEACAANPTGNAGSPPAKLTGTRTAEQAILPPLTPVARARGSGFAPASL